LEPLIERDEEHETSGRFEDLHLVKANHLISNEFEEERK
jgi:hypothetical protein